MVLSQSVHGDRNSDGEKNGATAMYLVCSLVNIIVQLIIKTRYQNCTNINTPIIFFNLDFRTCILCLKLDFI